MSENCRTYKPVVRERSANCPDEEVLQELAAGIGAPGLIDEHGTHIAACDRCALILKTYLHEFSDELTAEEEAMLGELESSTPEGQRKIVQRILNQVGERRSH
jgi:hypothetical protein